MYMQNDRQEHEAQVFEQIKNSFKKDFPARYVITHCAFMVFLNFALISTQITLIISDSYMAYLNIGIWCGVINMLTTFTAFVLSKNFFV